MIDDSTSKFCKLDQKNLLVIPEFLVTDKNVNFLNDSHLIVAIKFLESLSLDVRNDLEEGNASCLFNNLKI